MASTCDITLLIPKFEFNNTDFRLPLPREFLESDLITVRMLHFWFAKTSASGAVEDFAIHSLSLPCHSSGG
jgi:hypothetical protein